jgi:hypothetical protein
VDAALVVTLLVAATLLLVAAALVGLEVALVELLLPQADTAAAHVPTIKSPSSFA